MSRLSTVGDADVSRGAIARAARRIAPYVRRTPVIDIPLPTGQRIQCKLEMLQLSGSFKARGAFNALLSHLERGGEPRVAAASGGNHGIAVATAARELGLAADIFVPQTAPQAKQDKLHALGAKVVSVGTEYAHAFDACTAFVEASGALLCHAYDAAETLQGQGTVALEWQAQSPEIDTWLVAVGGGGLIGGMAAWAAGSPRVIAVETQGCAALHDALAAGHAVDVEVSGVAADSLGARRVGALALPIAERYVEQSLLVSDDDVIQARRFAWDHLRLLVEPGGVAALAAVLAGHYIAEADERIGVLICGSNTSISPP